MTELLLIPGTNKPFIFDRVSTTREHWIFSYYFIHEQKIDQGISITNKLSKLEELLSLPKGYHDALRGYTASFNESFSAFLLKKYKQESFVQKSFTNPVDKIRRTNDGVVYVSLMGIGVTYLPMETSLRGKGSLFIDKKHPFVLIAPDKTIYKYWGMNGINNTMIHPNFSTELKNNS